MPTHQILCSITNEAVTISEANNIHKHYENLVAIKNNGESVNQLNQNQLDDISLAWYINRIKSDSGDQVRKKYIQKFFIKESLKLIGHFIKLIGAFLVYVAAFNLLILLYPLISTIFYLLLIFSFFTYMAYVFTYILIDIFNFIKGHIQNHLQSKKLQELEPLIFTLVINEIDPLDSYNISRSDFLYRVDIRDPNLQQIGSFQFSYSTKLTHVTIPNSVTHIDWNAFSNCTNLTHVTIPNSVTHINWNAFRNCTKLTHVTIPNSVTHIDWNAFSNCTNLTHVTIPNSVTHIGDYAFENCTNLTHVTIPNSVTHIGIGAFENCTRLTQVTIPRSIISISLPFKDCPNLQIIAIDDSNQEDYQRIVNLLPENQQHLARPWSELKAAQETKQAALKSLAALSMRGIMTHLILKLSIKKGQEFLSVWQLLPRRLWVLEEWRAFSIRDGVLNQNLDHCILKQRVSPCAPGFATMLKKINIRMAVHLNSAVAEIPLPTSQEEREILFERVRETAQPYSKRMLLKPLQINQVAENCLDEDNHVASP
jgi:hypothetical protein